MYSQGQITHKKINTTKHVHSIQKKKSIINNSTKSLPSKSLPYQASREVNKDGILFHHNCQWEFITQPIIFNIKSLIQEILNFPVL